MLNANPINYILSVFSMCSKFKAACVKLTSRKVVKIIVRYS